MLVTWINVGMLAIESHYVVWLRCLKISGGGQAAFAEARLMVEEKVGEAIVSGDRLVQGASVDNVVESYRRVVRANVERLTR